MRALLLSDLAVVLPHLLDEKLEILERTLSGQLYLPYLAAQLRAVEALPFPSPVVGRPLAEALAEAEVRNETLVVLAELRTALADELSGDPVTYAHVETELFGFIDELAADREASVHRRARPTTMVTPGSVVDTAMSDSAG